MHRLDLSFLVFVVIASVWPVLLVIAFGFGISAVFVARHPRRRG